MADQTDIIVTVNGQAYSGWTSYSSHHSFDKAVGTLDLTISPQPGMPMPIKVGDKIQAIIGNRPVVTGHVHEVEGDDDWEKDERKIHARDKTEDFRASTVGPQKPVPPPCTLKQVLDKTVKGMGLDFSVLDNVNPDKFESGEVPSGAIDEFGHAFGDRLARQRQCLLNTDGKGNLVIDRNKGQRGPGAIHRGPSDDPMNNILHAKYRNGDLNRHNMCGVNSQHSTNDATYWEGQAKGFAPAQAQPLSKEYGVGYDDSVRPQRRLHTRAKHSLQRGKTKDAAKWRSNVAKGRGFNYTATVQGFEAVPGAIWWPGFIIPVFDHKYEISSELLIVDVKFHQSWSGGRTTELTFSYPDAFSDKDGKASAKAGRTSSLGSGAGGGQSDADSSDLTN